MAAAAGAMALEVLALPRPHAVMDTAPDSPDGAGGRRRRRLFGRVYRKPTSKSSWYVRYPDPERRRAPNGRVREIVRAVPSRRQAEALLAEVRKALLAGRYEPPPSVLAPGGGGHSAAGLREGNVGGAPSADGAPRVFSVLDAIDEYIDSRRVSGRCASTVEGYAGHRSTIARSALAGLPAEAVTPADIEAFRAWRIERSWKTVRRPGRVDHPEVREVARACSNATVNRALMVLGASFNRLVRLGRLRENPIARVTKAREVRQPRVALAKEEALRLLDATGPALRPLVAAGLYTGARLGELLRLTWGDVNFGTGTLSLFRPKVGNASRIPLHPRLAEELLRTRAARAEKERREIPDAEPIFLSGYGRPWVTVRRAFGRALRRAGLDGRRGLTFHSLRHTFAVHFLEGGAAVTDLQGVLGHADLSTTQIYARMVDSRTRASLVALDYGAPAPGAEPRGTGGDPAAGG